PRQGKGPDGWLHHGAPPAWPPWAVPPAPASARYQRRLRCAGRTLGAWELLALCAAAPQVAVALAEYVAQDAQDRGDPPLGRGVFPAVSQRLGDQRAKGPSPLAVSERGALWSQRRGEPPALCPAYCSL